MKRPRAQWYTTHLQAERQDFPSAEALKDHILTLQITVGVLKTLCSSIDHKLRLELFSVQSDHEAKTQAIDLGRERWVIFSPKVQVISDALVNDPCMVEDISLAAQSWLIARGYEELNLLDRAGKPLLSRSDIADLNHERAIDRLNAILKKKAFREGSRDFNSAIEKIITLAPSNLEIVTALGAEVTLIACEDSSEPPPALSKIERLGPDLNPDLNRVVLLKPELVLSSLSVPGMERIITYLHRFSVPQLVLAPRSLADVQRDIMEVASRLRIKSRGEELNKSLDQQKKALIARRSKELIPIYLEWWPKPMFTPGSSCFSNELIELAGGVNVFRDREGSSVEISALELVEASPTLCFLSWCGAAFEKLNPNNLRSRAGLEGLNPTAREWVIPIDESFSGRPGPNMLEASRQMANAIESYLKTKHSK